MRAKYVCFHNFLQFKCLVFLAKFFQTSSEICFLKNYVNVLYHILFKLKLLNSMAPEFFLCRNMASDNSFSQIISDGNPLLFTLLKK